MAKKKIELPAGIDAKRAAVESKRQDRAIASIKDRAINGQLVPPGRSVFDAKP